MILTDTTNGKSIVVHDAATHQYRSRSQKAQAEKLSAKYIFVTGDNHGRLPLWVKRILAAQKLAYHQIGYTTFRTNTFALYEVKE